MDTAMILYNREACPYCKVVREKLSALELTYLCVNVSPDKGKRSKLYEISGQRSVPTLIAGDKVITTEQGILDYLALYYENDKCHDSHNSCLMPEQKNPSCSSWHCLEQIPWQNHLTASGVKIKPYISQKEHHLDVTCMLVKVPVGLEVPEHTHLQQDDILFPLSGKAAMWIDGIGDFALIPGVAVRIPQGVRHKIYDVKEELLIHDVFFPALI
jgi:glutaredoxin/quercetin dioxygenase-like cupin family protein